MSALITVQNLTKHYGSQRGVSNVSFEVEEGGAVAYRERVVPLHEDAAQALQTVINLRKDPPERPFTDERTGEEIRYLLP